MLEASCREFSIACRLASLHTNYTFRSEESAGVLTDKKPERSSPSLWSPIKPGPDIGSDLRLLPLPPVQAHNQPQQIGTQCAHGIQDVSKTGGKPFSYGRETLSFRVFSLDLLFISRCRGGFYARRLRLEKASWMYYVLEDGSSVDDMRRGV